MILQIAAFIIGMVGMTIYCVQLLLKKRQVRAAILYSGLMGICMVYGSFIFAKVHVPSTITPLKTLFEPIGKIILKQ
ncbi:hypothetical protein FHS16_001968 [Paenibacillus endophyticus]|uniref:Uncharacterized protein n=1 Tax=Paenibacillus endophyticus TaxID=1294268 RepID=A0A7W5C676_9BACL|nr:hypothetical protein [Paenibacillus endophyticus]MBB3151922.1 hypothetical protein [Paenibacillus endophyticus]